MLVVDASVAIKLVVEENGTAEARRLLTGPDPLIAPEWLLIEAANTFWKKIRRSELPVADAQRRLALLPRFFATLHQTADLAAAALGWGTDLGHPVYDCLYIALALRESAGLVTADARLHAAEERTALAGRVRLIA